MSEDLTEREGVPLNEQPIWVDWSGISAVWVCSCGKQGFGGFSAAEGRAAAMRHRSVWHPEWPAWDSVHIEAPPCRWSGTRWAEIRGETDMVCDAPVRSDGLCSSHYGAQLKYNTNGICAIDGCVYTAHPKQDVCVTHGKKWAKAHGLNPADVTSGALVWPNVPKVHPRDLVPLTKAGAKRVHGDPITLPYKVEHGTRAGYKAGCRCRDCGDVQSAYARQARVKRLLRERDS